MTKYDNWLVNPIAGDMHKECPTCGEYVWFAACECWNCGYVPRRDEE